MFEDWSDEDLAGIGLKRGDGGIEIVIPPEANIYHMTVGGQIAAGRGAAPALVFERADGTAETWTFAGIEAAARALAARLRALGAGRGDPVGLHTGMRPETAIAHMAVCMIGGIAVTLSQLYGPDALAHALNHSGARSF